MADNLESLCLKFVALFSYSSRKYQIPNIKKTYYAHFAKNPSTASVRINNNIFISSIDKTEGHVYLGMLFIPTEQSNETYCKILCLVGYQRKHSH